MTMQAFQQVTHLLGLDNVVPVLLAVMTLARAVDALIAQPAPGSHWIPLRKVLSLAGFGFGNAKPAGQPALVTWLQRLVMMLAQAVPVPSTAVPPPPAPVVPPAPLAPPAPAPAPAPAPMKASMSDRLPTVADVRNVLGSPPTDSVAFRQP